MTLEALLARMKAGTADGTPRTLENCPGVPQSPGIKPLISLDKILLGTPGTPGTPKNDNTGRASEPQPASVPTPPWADVGAKTGEFSDLVAVEPSQPEPPMPVVEPEPEAAADLKRLQVSEDLEASPPCKPEPPPPTGPDLSDLYGRARRATYICELEEVWREIDARKAAWRAPSP